MRSFLNVIALAFVVLFVSIFVVSFRDTGLADGVAIENKNLNIDQNDYLDVASDLRCPTCTGLSVLDSEAAFSIQIKNEVKEQLAAGKHKQDILNFFTERYGPWILRAPPTHGVHLLAWIVPIATLILGPLVLWMFVWMRKKSGPDEEIISRSVEDIIAEMNQRLASMRAKNGGTK